jgi:hypothetical protein
MKIKINFLIGIVWLASFSVAMAQVSTPAGVTIEGTPYLSETYVVAEIHFDKGNPTKLPVRYNAFQDLIEYKQNGQSLVLDPSTRIKKVDLGDNTLVVDKIEFKGKAKYGFLTLLDSGKVMLLSKKMVTYVDAKASKALDGSEITSPAKFSRSPDTYYYKVGDGELQKVGSIKDMIANFPDMQEELLKYAKKEKISPKKEAELIQLVHYYNSL